MILNKILNIGVGRAGNVIVNEMLKKDKRYSGLFVNSAIDDIEGLEKCDINKNLYIFPGAAGSGRDRNVAREFLQDHISGLVEMINKYVLQDTVLVYFSMDGGTGSGVGITIATAIKRRYPNKKVIIIPVSPNKNRVDKLALENAIECWNDIMNALDSEKSPSIDSVIFVDNSTRDTYGEINAELVDSLHNAMTMNGKCESGSIDDGDNARVFTSLESPTPFVVPIVLESDYEYISEAIKASIKTSIFACPEIDEDTNKIYCGYVAASVSDYEPMEVIEEFDYDMTYYVAENNKHNTVLLSGCDEPTYIISEIKEVYDSAINKRNNRRKREKTTIDIKPKEQVSKKKATKKTTVDNYKIDDDFDDLDDLFSDLF